MAAIAIPEKFAPLSAAYVEDAARKTTMWGVWLDTMRENIATVGADSLDFAQLDLLLDTVANGTGILESNLSRKGSLFWHMETDTHRVTFHAEGMCFRLGVPASVFSKGEKWTVTIPKLWLSRTSWYREAGDALHEWRSIYYTKASVFI
jgi:hypothetical protein